MGDPLEERQRGAWLAIIQHNTTSCCRLRDDAQRRPERGLREIRDNAEPRKQCLRATIEASSSQGVQEFFSLEVDWHQLRLTRHGEPSCGKKLTLPRLRSGVINLKHPQIRIRVPQRKGIQARPEQNILGDAGRNSSRQAVLCKSAAHHEPRSQPNGVWPVRTARCALQLGHSVAAKNRNGERVGEDQRRRIVELMSRPPEGHPKRRP